MAATAALHKTTPEKSGADLHLTVGLPPKTPAFAGTPLLLTMIFTSHALPG